MRFWSTVVIMLILIGLAHRFGRGPERTAAHLLGINLFCSILNSAIGTPSFNSVNYTLAGVDALTMVGLVWLAIRANRFWPLVVASLQFVVIIAHASVFVSIGWTQVYYGMMALSQYCELVVLAAGISSHYVRERRVGRYREWRRGYEPRPLTFAVVNHPEVFAAHPS